VDFWLVPDVAVQSSLFRILASFVLFGVYALLRWHKWGERYPEALMCLAVLIPQLHYVWLTPQTGDAFAYHFAGYAVMMYGYAALIPGRVIWVIAANVFSGIAMLLSLSLFGTDAVTFDLIAVYVFFAAMLLAGISSSINSWRLHYNQFLARQALIGEKDRTEELLVQLEHVSRRDPLTNLANRRYWEETLRLYWTEDQAMCLAIIDLDHFKSINDLYGHKAGDDALVMFARVLEAKVRDQGFVARLGGDEFAVLLLDDNKEVYEKVFLEIMEASRAIRLAEHLDCRVSISVGVAVRDLQDLSPFGLVMLAELNSFLG